MYNARIRSMKNGREKSKTACSGPRMSIRKSEFGRQHPSLPSREIGKWRSRLRNRTVELASWRSKLFRFVYQSN